MTMSTKQKTWGEHSSSHDNKNKTERRAKNIHEVITMRTKQKARGEHSLNNDNKDKTEKGGRTLMKQGQ